MAIDQWQLWTDGGARGNPGPAAAGMVIEHNGEVVWQAGVFLGHTVTNNQAEYQALQLGVEKALALGATSIAIRMDSQLVVEQVHGRYKVKDDGLRERCAAVRSSLSDFEHWSLQHVPRAENQAADSLVNEALDKQLAVG